MHELDLIPADYRYWQWQRTWLMRAAIVTGVALSLTFAGWWSSERRNVALRAEVAGLTAQQSEGRELNTAIDAERQRLAYASGQLATLEGLRSGAPARDIVLMIDRALSDIDVWFESWEFERAGIVAQAAGQTTNRGYFIVVDEETPTTPENARVRTDMRIRGHASDHSALSSFVRNLVAQPEIDDVRVERTYSSPGASEATVSFDLAVVLTTRVGAPS